VGRGGSVAGVDERQFAGRAWRRARERKGEESTAASGGFLKFRRRGRGGGSGSVPRGGRERKRKRGPERGMRQHGGAASTGSGPAATRAGGVAWHVARPAEQGRGEGLTGGPRHDLNLSKL
jgi:hypothetical protein